jgi:hypothetical protein
VLISSSRALSQFTLPVYFEPSRLLPSYLPSIGRLERGTRQNPHARKRILAQFGYTTYLQDSATSLVLEESEFHAAELASNPV